MTSILISNDQFKNEARRKNNKELQVIRKETDNIDHIKAIDEILMNREKGIEKEPFVLSSFKYIVNWIPREINGNSIKTIIDANYDYNSKDWLIKANHNYMLGDTTATLELEKSLNKPYIMTTVRGIDFQKINNFKLTSDDKTNNPYIEFEYNNYKIEYLITDEPKEIQIIKMNFNIDEIINNFLEQIKKS